MRARPRQARMLGGIVHMGVPSLDAFDYLVDPNNRAQWQSSLRAVEDVDGWPRLGQTWVDVTKPGLRPVMETTEFRRPMVWSETGTWRFVRADLTLRFRQAGSGCDVHYQFRIRALGPLGLLATAASLPPVGADLRRAARILAGTNDRRTP